MKVDSRDSVRIPCAILRGGTSKGVFFHERDLPPDPVRRDRAILAAFGSADCRQIDGLGGADPLTSKVAVLSPSRRPDADVDYVCGQVGIGTPTVDFSLHCGNLAAAAALFAIREGLVTLGPPAMSVRIFHPPTASTCVARVLTDSPADGGDADSGPATGFTVELRFAEAAGASTGSLLPTGRAVDRLARGDGAAIGVSIVDAGNLYAFAAAADLGLAGDEPAEAIESDRVIVGEAVRLLARASAAVAGAARGPRRPAVQRLCLVSPPRHAAGRADLTARIVTAAGRVHKAFAVTGAIAAAFAAFVPGSVVHAVAAGRGPLVRIAHPEGVMRVGVELGGRPGARSPVAATVRRSARLLLEGRVHVPRAAIGIEEREDERRAARFRAAAAAPPVLLPSAAGR